jgi:protocatechuate 3,4-dioxygenase beta subunit
MNLRPRHPSVNLSRRQLLRLFGVTAATAIAGRKFLEQLPFNEASAATVPACVVRPAQTEGPYFVDEKLNRSDIRSDPSDNSPKAGVPLHLQFRVSQIAGGACTPLSSAIVDIWHCDAHGVYSDVRDAGFDTRGKKFLRGFQKTDARGVAQFFTIYPGWYEGRAVHIHFKIRGTGTSARRQEFTSQLYFDESVTDQIFKQAPYSGKTGRRIMNDGDSISGATVKNCSSPL